MSSFLDQLKKHVYDAYDNYLTALNKLDVAQTTANMCATTANKTHYKRKLLTPKEREKNIADDIAAQSVLYAEQCYVDEMYDALEYEKKQYNDICKEIQADKDADVAADAANAIANASYAADTLSVMHGGG